MKSIRGNEGHPDHGGKVQHDETDAARREMLAKIGRFAYVAPAFLILAEPKLVEAYGSARDIPPGPPSNVPPGHNK